MTVYDRVKALADENNKKIANIEAETGLSNGTISKWKKSIPYVDTLKKVADYFHVSIEELLA